MKGNSMLKIMLVFGTRPEAIKMAPLILELKKRDNIETKVLVTAQHREMLDQVMNVFGIEADFDLNLMKHGQTIFDITNGVLYGVSEVIDKYRPDLLLVHGDTTTTFASALAGFYKQVTVGHVEAGLRTNNIYSPYPEEMNRQLTTRLCTYHFAPTVSNKNNLLTENVCGDNIVVTGNTVIDALKYAIEKKSIYEDDRLNNIPKDKKIILMTCHRRENWGKPMEEIFRAVKKIADEYDDSVVVFPMHKNPSIRELAEKILASDNIILTEPLDYQPFTQMMSDSYLILTDSGGIQEEAPGLGKPVIVLRSETERPEAVEAGTVVIGGVSEAELYKNIKFLLDNHEKYKQMAKATNPYGDGKSSKRIVEYILKKYGVN